MAEAIEQADAAAPQTADGNTPSSILARRASVIEAALNLDNEGGGTADHEEEEAAPAPAPAGPKGKETAKPAILEVEAAPEEEESEIPIEGQESKEGEAEAEAERGEEEGEPLKVTPEVQKQIDRRIGKEIAKRKVLEAELEELKAKPEAMEAKPDSLPVLPPIDLSVKHPQVLEIEKLENSARQVQQYAKGLLRRLATEPETVAEALRSQNIVVPGGYTQEGMQEYLSDAAESAGDDARKQAMRKEVVAEKVRAEADTNIKRSLDLAFEIYPKLKEPKSAERAMAESILKANPHLRNSPYWPLQLADMTAGAMVRMARNGHTNGNGAAKPAASGKPVTKPPKLPGASAAPAAPTGTTKDVVRQSVLKDPSNSEKRAKYFESLL